MTDDTLVDLDSLDLMMNEINQKFNTDKDTIIKGHLYALANKMYPQGGSGFLMSRVAAIKFLEFGHEWAKKLAWPDDTHLDIVIRKLNISIGDDVTVCLWIRKCY